MFFWCFVFSSLIVVLASGMRREQADKRTGYETISARAQANQPLPL